MGGRKSPFPITLAIGLYNSLYYSTSRDIIHNNMVDIKYSVAVNIYSTAYRLQRACHLAIETDTVYTLMWVQDAGSWVCLSHIGRVRQLTSRIGRTIGQPTFILDPYPVEQNGSDCWQAIPHVLYRNRCHFWNKKKLKCFMNMHYVNEIAVEK